MIEFYEATNDEARIRKEAQEEIVEEPSPAGSRRLKTLTRFVNFALHILGF